MKPNNPQNIKRYTNFGLPVYKFVPGKATHPSKNAEQNHIPALPKTDELFSGQNWQKSEHYLFAIDLFNLGYYWEVHEVLEKIWMQTGKESPEGEFIQGLIQLSVALLKKLQSNTRGVKRLFDKALPKILSQSGVYLGIEVDLLLEQFKIFINNGRQAPVILLKFG